MIDYSVSDGIGIVELCDPERLNALTDVDLAELGRIAASAHTDASVRALLITGAGRAFSVGGHVDKMGELLDSGPVDVRASLAAWQEPLAALERLEKPVVAAVNGLCVAAGAALILACDLRVAANGARIAFPSVDVGLVTDMGCTHRLPRLIGLGRAKHYLMTADWIDAPTAERIGLVTCVLDDEGFREAALAFVAERLLRHSPVAQGVMKRLVDCNAGAVLETALENERLAQAVLYAGEEARAGHRTMVERG